MHGVLCQGVTVSEDDPFLAVAVVAERICNSSAYGEFPARIEIEVYHSVEEQESGEEPVLVKAVIVTAPGEWKPSR